MKPQPLTLESTLQELPLHNYQVTFDCLGDEIAHVLDQSPLLPGVILFDQDKLCGMISRRRFLEQISRPYGLDLFLKRPLKALYPFVKAEFLSLPGNTLIVQATQQALGRSPEFLYEPIVVEIAPNVYRLLDFHHLLVAHSTIHELAQQVIREKTEAQIIQTEKMASLGRIIASVAHEILNPVNFISGNLNYLANYSQDLISLLKLYDEELPQLPERISDKKEDLGLDFILQDLPRLIDSMKLGAERLKSIVGGLRNFSHMNENTSKPTDIHQAIDNTLVILNNKLKAGVDVIKHYGTLPPVNCYSGQLSQVFMNILSNAIDALMEKYVAEKMRHPVAAGVVTLPAWQPQITILTEIRGADIEPNSSNSSFGDAPSAVIRIQDNGPGIPPAIQEKIFETFFTTKAVGEGTGLGLAISRQIIVEKHQGQLNLKSELGVGTEFEIVLPLR